MKWVRFSNGMRFHRVSPLWETTGSTADARPPVLCNAEGVAHTWAPWVLFRERCPRCEKALHGAANAEGSS